jgi:excisionase family DNA binding protein
MNKQTTRYPKRQSGLRVSPEQEAVIRMYAEQVGEKIGRLVSEIIIDSLTLLWAEKPTSQPSVIREQPVVREQPVSDRLLNAAEVAKRLGISKAKAYQLMLRGEIPTVRMGRNVRVRPQDLEVFINRQVE